MILDEYKNDMRIQNKRFFQNNIDYRSKLQSMAKQQKHINEINKERPFYIFNIDHHLGFNNKVVFNMKVTEIDNTTFFMKSQLRNQKKYTVDLEVSVLEITKIQQIVIDFCKTQKISFSDEVSLTNYVYVMVEGYRIQVEAKKLILEIQNLKTDELLQECQQNNVFIFSDFKPGSKPPESSQNLDIFHKYIDKKKKEIENKIFEKLKYKNPPFRVFERFMLYEDIKAKLYCNLTNSIKLVKQESERIIKRYRKLEFYIEELAFGKKEQVKLKRKQKHATVDILLKKQRQLNTNYGVMMKRASSNLRNSKFDFGNYRMTSTVYVDTSPGKDFGRASGELTRKNKNTPSPDKAANIPRKSGFFTLDGSVMNDKRTILTRVQSSIENQVDQSSRFNVMFIGGQMTTGQNTVDNRYDSIGMDLGKGAKPKGFIVS